MGRKLLYLASVKERLNAKAVADRNQELYEKSKGFENFYPTEYHYASNEMSLSQISTQYDRTNVDYTMSWSENTQTITTGFTHVHPFPSCPSPADAFMGALGINSTGTNSMISKQKEIFYQQFYSTVITERNVYVITIKNKTKWLEESSKVAQREEEFTELKNEYKEKFDLNETDAQLRAFLEMYGGIVNLYRSSKTYRSMADLNYKNIFLGPEKYVIDTPRL